MTKDATLDRSQDQIRNCPWGYKCEKTWDQLIVTDLSAVRFCDACAREVHLCSTQEELSRAIVLNHCAAFSPKLLDTMTPELRRNEDPVEESDLAERFSLVGEVDDNYWSKLTYRKGEDAEKKYPKDQDRHLSTSSEYSSAGYLRLGDDGGLYMETEYFGPSDTEAVTWIKPEEVPRLLKSLGLSLPNDASQSQQESILAELNSRFRNVEELKSWLSRHHISCNSWSWSSSASDMFED